MSNAISRAARERQARTGEPYTLARRMVIEEHAKLKAEQAEPGIEVTPENAQRLFTEGKISVNQAREAHGLPPFEPAAGEDVGSFRIAPAPPVPFRDEAVESALASRVEWLGRLFGPLSPEPSSGPPYTHVHRLPETDKEIAEMAAGPWPPITHTITREGE